MNEADKCDISNVWTLLCDREKNNWWKEALFGKDITFM